MLDVQKIRQDFPILKEKTQDYPLVYFDNAATTQKPQSVIDSQVEFYTKYNSNIGRGKNLLAWEAEEKFLSAKEKVRKFINAKDQKEIIFTKGTTEGINFLATVFGRTISNEGVGKDYGGDENLCLEQGDEIIISESEHHSNFVPWQVLAEEKKLKLSFISINLDGTLNLEEYKKLLNPKVKLVAITHISNVLGILNPIKEMAKLAHENGTLVIVDGAQAVAHVEVDVQDLDVDFYCFSAHKMYGPLGIGVLYGKNELLEKIAPYQFGGGMVFYTSKNVSRFSSQPDKFEAGTLNIAGAYGLAAAIDYLTELRKNFDVKKHEHDLLKYFLGCMEKVQGIQILNTNQDIPLVCFNVLDVHPNDLAMLLGYKNICLRTGSHCSEPLTKKYDLHFGVLRVSFSFYNTIEEIDYFMIKFNEALKIIRD